VTGLRFGASLALWALLLPAQELTEAERKVSEFTLPNGMHFILMERHQVPVVSFHTYVNSGSAQDPAGRTGIAHLVERLAFQGTESIGSANWASESKTLDEVEAAYDRLEAERNKGLNANQGRMASLEIDLGKGIVAAKTLADPAQYRRAIEENGGVGLTSHTTPDSMETSYSLPSNRIELWFLMESQRLTHPVFRDFYLERDAMLAENRNTVDARSLPKLQQALLATAFAAHPYRNPPLGWPGDIANLRRNDAKAFFDTYCVPGNIVMGIVGDVDPANARRLAERYFGAIPAKPLPPVIHTGEPPQLGPKTVVLVSHGQPILLVGYKRPSQTNRDDVALDVIREILAEGQAGWLHKELVETRRIAQQTDATATFPAGRDASLFVYTVVPAQNHTVEENQKALDNLLARLQAAPVDAATLERAKNGMRARLIRTMGSNRRLAALLPAMYAGYGDWRKLFTYTAELSRVTADGLQRVAAQYFTSAQRTVAYIEDGAEPAAPPSAPGAAQ
jgi:predicted Zn-dependent peptidase